MRTSTIETLEEGECIFGSRTAGPYMVRFYEDGVEQAGTFCQIKEAAEVKARDWETDEKIETPEERVERWTHTLNER